MTPAKKISNRLAWATLLVGLFAAPVHAWGAELPGASVSASLPSTSVSVGAPSVSVTVAPVKVTVPSTPTAAPVKVTVPSTTSTSTPLAGTMPAVKGVTRSPSVSARSTSAPTNGRPTNTYATVGQGPPGAASSPSSGYVAPGAVTPRALGRLSRPERARELALMATVRRLAGCLGNLPDRLRLVLQLRAGVNVPSPRSPRAVAKYLHISVGEVTQLEKRALRQLRQTARTNICGRATQTASGPLAFSGFGSTLGEDGGATGGVKGARYTKLLSRERSRPGVKHSSPSTAPLLWINIPPVASDAMLVILIVLALVLLVSFVLADAAGLGPRHRQWRSRWMRRPPWV
jgi:Sigma-70, region 4